MTSLGGVHAVIIEDDQVSVDVLRSLLGQLEVTTTVVLGDQTIPERIGRLARPDVIFVDLEMPGYNGYQVLEMLRDDREFEGVPIVAYTTHISHMNNARAAGFDSFLGKPLHRVDFADNLTRILNGESIWEAP